jgi:hypothetical protein
MEDELQESIDLGRCAECGDVNIQYGVLQVEGEGVHYPYTCRCGHEGKEHYDLVYQGTE